MMVPTTLQTMTSTTILDVIIVGGGLSGLCVGNGLLVNDRDKSWIILEASNRIGGRLINASPTVPIDMGGAWIWPRHQPLIHDLVSELKVSTFVQPDDPSSSRLDGGAVRFIERLSEKIRNTANIQTNDNKLIDGNRIILNSPVVSCKLLNNNNDNIVQLTTQTGSVYITKKVVFAVPPKVLSESVIFDPPLSNRKRLAMSSSRTWMAGVTKVALQYPNRFWDKESTNTGLPSSWGPAFQVYDGSTKDGTIAALTFFTHIPPNDIPAQSNDAIVAKQVASQMAKYWDTMKKPDYSKHSFDYSSFYVHRWPNNPYISGSDTTPERIYDHPTPNHELATPEWDGRILFAGTETDLHSPGVMEGAVGAAKRVLKSMFSST